MDRLQTSCVGCCFLNGNDKCRVGHEVKKVDGEYGETKIIVPVTDGLCRDNRPNFWFEKYKDELFPQLQKEQSKFDLIVAYTSEELCGKNKKDFIPQIPNDIRDMVATLIVIHVLPTEAVVTETTNVLSN